MERTLRTTVFVLVALACPLPRLAWADPANATFALVVTNNRSSMLTLPDLQYADDDGARYHRMFRSVADAEGVFLLTTFDRSSTAAYPELAGQVAPPTRASVEEAVKKIAAGVESARLRGAKTAFYFVYAGHGDVEDGQGYIDLEDGRADGRFIEDSILDRIQADAKHVILDSCNSFFVMNPRKPGGRRWATPKDMALGFGKRHPEVGLFLSTNSDAEVFEWSELESGVFSHEVRSGLAGAADVNGDGNVSYAELAGFVTEANARITRDTLRPHIFYRGPNGDSDQALFSPSKSAGRRLILGNEEMRLWIKGDDGERLLDLHKEAGPMTIVLPNLIARRISVFVEQKATSAKERPTVVEHPMPNGEGEIVLAQLEAEKPSHLARGDRLFASLFAAPYGPVAYQTFVAAGKAESETVYGISDRDVLRMNNYISAIADSDRQTRFGVGGFLLGVGAVVDTAVLVAYADSPRWSGPGGKTGAIVAGSLGAALIGGGAYLLASRSSGEVVRATFEKELAEGHARTTAFAKTDQALEDLARRDRRTRNLLFWAYEAAGVSFAATATYGLIKPGSGDTKFQPSNSVMLYGLSAVFIGGGFVLRSIELPTERFLKLYRSDPDLKVHFGVTPTPSGAMVGASGRF